MASVRLGLLRTSAGVGSTGRLRRISHRSWSVLHWWLTLLVGHAVLWAWGALRVLLLLSAVVIGMAHLPTGVLRDVRDDLHAAGYHALRTSVTYSVRGSSRTTEAISQLLDERAADVVGCDMHSVSHSQHDEGALGGERQAGLRCIQTGSGGFLDLTNPDTLLADDGTNEDVRDEQTKRVGLGLWGRWLVEWLLVERADDETESLDECQQ